MTTGDGDKLVKHLGLVSLGSLPIAFAQRGEEFGPGLL